MVAHVVRVCHPATPRSLCNPTRTMWRQGWHWRRRSGRLSGPTPRRRWTWSPLDHLHTLHTVGVTTALTSVPGDVLALADAPGLNRGWVAACLRATSSGLIDGLAANMLRLLELAAAAPQRDVSALQRAQDELRWARSDDARTLLAYARNLGLWTAVQGGYPDAGSPSPLTVLRGGVPLHPSQFDWLRVPGGVPAVAIRVGVP